MAVPKLGYRGMALWIHGGWRNGPGHVTVTVKTMGQYDINTVLYGSTWAWLQIDGSMDPWGMEKGPGHVTVTVTVCHCHCHCKDNGTI